MAACNKANQPPGALCSIIECSSNFDPQKNDWELKFCPINNMDQMLCADEAQGDPNQHCIPNQSYGVMGRPSRLWTYYGCSSNFTICYYPTLDSSTKGAISTTEMFSPTGVLAPAKSSFPTTADSTRANATSQRTTTPVSTSTSFIDRTSTSRTGAFNRIDKVDSSLIIGGIVGGAVAVLLLIILLIVVLRCRKKAKKHDNTSDIEWEDYTGKSRTQNGGNKGIADDSTLHVRPVQNENETTVVNGSQKTVNGHEIQSSKQDAKTHTSNASQVGSNANNGKVPKETNGGLPRCGKEGQKESFSV